MNPKVEAEIDRKMNSLKREVASLRAKQRMREQMYQVWKDFFEKNPALKEEVPQPVEEWLRSKLGYND